MNKLLRVISLFFILSPMLKADGEEPSSDVLTIDAHVEANACGDWVIGSRLWLSLDIRNTRQRQVEGPIIEEILFRFDAYNYELKQVDSEKIVAERTYVRPALGELLFDQDGHPAGQEMPIGIAISPSESIRVLCPISWPSSKNIPPGQYQLSLTVLAPFGEVGRASLAVKVIVPKQEEKKIIDLFAFPDDSWSPKNTAILTENIPEKLATDTGIGFERLLATLTTISDNNLSAKALEIEKQLANLPKFFAPEAKLIEFDLQRRLKQNEAADKTRNTILADYPAIGYRIRMAEPRN